MRLVVGSRAAATDKNVGGAVLIGSPVGNSPATLSVGKYYQSVVHDMCMMVIGISVGVLELAVCYVRQKLMYKPGIE